MCALPNFSERLKELLFDNKVTAKQFAEAIGVGRSTAYRWTLEPLQINRANLIAAADYFECTIEYLIGRTEDASKVTRKALPDFSTQVRKIIKERGFTTYSLRKKTKFNISYLRRWENGEEPVLQTLVELSNLLSCTIDYLVGRE